MSPVATPWQTVGPFFSIGLDWPEGGSLAGETAPGDRISLSGRVLDGEAQPVADAVLELWQADAAGRYPDPAARPNSAFRGFGRLGTDAQGGFRFTTVRPGRVAAPGGGLQAPHILVTVQARGLLAGLLTRIYFAGDAANESDPVLSLVPSGRRRTLLAQPAGSGAWHWDLRLQGEGETVFFSA